MGSQCRLAERAPTSQLNGVRFTPNAKQSATLHDSGRSLRRRPRSGNTLDFRSVLTGGWLLAGFDPQWSDFEFENGLI
jgi:hypothetical protein